MGEGGGEEKIFILFLGRLYDADDTNERTGGSFQIIFLFFLKQDVANKSKRENEDGAVNTTTPQTPAPHCSPLATPLGA